MADEHARVKVTLHAELGALLQQNHGRTTSIWLVKWKKGAGARSVAYRDIVEEALCFSAGPTVSRASSAHQSQRKSGSV
jgi:hypothetical protein